MITVSIVSHGHGLMVLRLVEQLMAFPEVGKILITKNVPESNAFPQSPKLEILLNKSPKGFAANHNAAFAYCKEDFFCPLNPDVEFLENPFPALLDAMADERVGMVAPRVDSPNGQHEDSWRHFPTPLSLIRKFLKIDDGRYQVPVNKQSFSPDWVAGMFMLFRSQTFRRIGGFDKSFFLYYEDVDICARLWKSGVRILACPSVAIVHDARRDSHRKWKHLYWHLSSMVRYFVKHKGMSPR